MRRVKLFWALAAWFCLSLVVGACFGGGFAQGLSCKSDADCEPQLSCIEGNCGGLGDPALCGNGLRDVGEECDDGNVNDGDGCSANCLLPPFCGDGVVQEGEACDDGNAVETDECTTSCALSPGEPTLDLKLAQVKQFEFSWEPVLGAEYYQLFERANRGAGFVQVGEDIKGNSYSLTVPLHLRVNASYKLDACSAARCVASNVVDVVGNLAEAVGYFKASNTGAYDHFGISVALSRDGDTLAVGAEGEGSHAKDIDGDQGDNSADASGAVYVFARTADGWSQQAYVKASNTHEFNGFGYSVALSADGNTLAVGARLEGSPAMGIDGNGDQDKDPAEGAGAVYVFVRTFDSWSPQAYVKASNTGPDNYFGYSVALSGDGETLAVGAIGESFDAGAVYVFVRTPESWSPQAYVKASNTGEGDEFGKSVALSGDGDTLAVGAIKESAGAGAVYVFVRAVESWSQQAYVKASNTDGVGFGNSVVLSSDGHTLAVGASGHLSNLPDIGDELAGAVYVFVQAGESWSQQAHVRASNTRPGDGFGLSVALSTNGKILAVGAQGESSHATGIDGNQDDESADRAGAVYVFIRTGAVWSQLTYVKASRTIGDDVFGISVALSEDGTTMAVGAPGENFGTTGIGNQTNIGAFDAGAVYLY